ncbi:hypothetical protein HYALB_00011842 [Hymenoscyphus albidus]|uniref:Uncharacterized protein n=1 Tax=Hymenoscyphus albidus TaxID=595503 RepID=A0A9N9Q9C6_9HELO|nr:hypothetical protein HYALB_00011842 [Hymenoscyphus albidus]
MYKYVNRYLLSPPQDNLVFKNICGPSISQLKEDRDDLVRASTSQSSTNNSLPVPNMLRCYQTPGVSPQIKVDQPTFERDQDRLLHLRQKYNFVNGTKTLILTRSSWRRVCMKPRRMIIVLLPIWLPILLVLGLLVLFYTTGGMKALNKPNYSLNGTEFANHTTFSAPSPLCTATIPGSTVTNTYWTTTTYSLASSTTAAPEAVNASSTTTIVARAVSVPQVILSTDSSQPTSNSLKLHNIAVGCRQLPNDTSAISGFQTQIRPGTFTSSATVTPTSLVPSPTTTAPYNVSFHPI